MKEKQDEVKPEIDDLALTDEELDRVFGGMTGAYVCAGKQQSVVLS
jgi:hypothetical protein